MAQLDYDPELSYTFRSFIPIAYRPKPRIKALYDSFIATAQVVEDFIFLAMQSYIMEQATDAALDNIGTIVQEQRLGLNNTEYRRLLVAKIRAVRSGGTIDDVLAVWELLMNPLYMRHTPVYPAGFQLFAVTDTYLSEAYEKRIYGIMKLAKAGGVNVILGYSIPGYFSWPDDPSPYKESWGGHLPRQLTGA